MSILLIIVCVRHVIPKKIEEKNQSMQKKNNDDVVIKSVLYISIIDQKQD